MNILLRNVRITATRNTEAIINVEMLAFEPSLIAEVEKYTNRGPKTKPMPLEVIAAACSRITFFRRTVLAKIITGMLIPVLKTAKSTCVKRDGTEKICKRIPPKFDCTLLGTT